MKLGDHPDFRKLTGEKEQAQSAPDKQPNNPGKAQSPGSKARSNATSSALFPNELLFETFYNDHGRLRMEIFFEAAQQAAQIFHQAQLKPHALRLLFQGFQSVALPLRDNTIEFEEAKERFGIFYVERVVRQHKRGFLPDVVMQFMERHKNVALRNREEMLGLFRYLTNILCYFGDKE